MTPLSGFKGFTVSAVCGYVRFVYVIFVLFRAMKKKYNTAAADIQRMSHDLEASTRHADVSTYNHRGDLFLSFLDGTLIEIMIMEMEDFIRCKLCYVIGWKPVWRKRTIGMKASFSVQAACTPKVATLPLVL